MDTMSLELKAINTIRTLSMDAVQAANSGHPGTPMALAPLAYLLYTEVMRHNPANPHWAARDRFVLSAGHASMLQYATLHLTGYGVSLDDIKDFRQWESMTPGHPEVHHTPGIETTTGPLGQGISTAVGMALGERRAAALYNTEAHNLVDNFTYVIASDGDLMEGVAQEAISLAGHLKLGKLICFYDDNSITIDGRIDLAFSEDVGARFEACGWHTLLIEDVNDLDAVREAIAAAKAEGDRPTLIITRTIIGYGSPNKQDTSSAHGSPLGEDEVALSKKTLGWPEDARFLVPEEVAEHMDQRARGAAAERRWEALHAAWAEANAELAAQWRRTLDGELPEGWDNDLPTFAPEDGKLATRKSSQKILKIMHARLPELCGGSADLAGSNGMSFSEMGAVQAGDYAGPVLHFGIREHGMGAICSGLTLYGGARAYCATFLVFTDYMRASIRLAALMAQPVIYVMTHDSIGLGEDGPTHQPIEHLAALRAIPNLDVLRPADGNETREAWRYALQRANGPTMLVLTRQGLPHLAPTADPARVAGVHRGAYVLSDCEGEPELILRATGSEMAITAAAGAQLAADGVKVRVVSVPSRERFLAQDADYRDAVLPRSVTARLAVEAASPMSWHRFVGLDGDVIGIERFGASAPGGTLMQKYGFTTENIVARAKALL